MLPNATRYFGCWRNTIGSRTPSPSPEQRTALLSGGSVLHIPASLVSPGVLVVGSLSSDLRKHWCLFYDIPN